MTFKIISESGPSRKGILTTKSGTIETPFFMPVVTKATGKYITTDDYRDLGSGVRARAVICNALLLSLKPGIDILNKVSGIHKFMNFDGVVFTDCGGFQSSSTFFEKKSKKGLHFRSPYNNQRIVITPKKIIEIQAAINSDVAMMLDDMSPYGASYEEARVAMENTHRWAKESLEAHKKIWGDKDKDKRQLLFGIIQGNFYKDLREESAKFITSLDFDGFAIGGVAIGEPSEKMYEAVASVLPFLPADKPRYVMGVGSPEDVTKLISMGLDCFDSIYPTQNARHASIFTKQGKIYLDAGKYSEDFTPIEADCGCHTCKTYTKAYLNHLFKIKEPAVRRLLSIHNQWFLQELVNNNLKK